MLVNFPGLSSVVYSCMQEFRDSPWIIQFSIFLVRLIALGRFESKMHCAFAPTASHQSRPLLECGRSRISTYELFARMWKEQSQCIHACVSSRLNQVSVDLVRFPLRPSACYLVFFALGKSRVVAGYSCVFHFMTQVRSRCLC